MKDCIFTGEGKVLAPSKKGEGKILPFYTPMAGNGFNFLYFTKEPLEAAEGEVVEVSGTQRGTFSRGLFGLLVFELVAKEGRK